MNKLIISILCAAFLATSDAARILGVLHVPTPSHYFVGEAVLKGLADKGHDVTIASPFKSKEKNVNFREIFLDGVTEIADESRAVFFQLDNETTISLLMKFSNFSNALADKAMRSPGMQKLLKSGEKFDVIMVEPFGNEAFFGLAHVFNSHLTILCTAGSEMANHFAGNVAPFSFVPNGFSSYSDRMTFKERILNTLAFLSLDLYSKFLIQPVQKRLYEEMFKNVPPFEETLKNVSLVLVNTHVVFETPRPYVPNMIPIGGAHIKEPKKLPQDLQTYLDNAKEGVIYFSLGSNLHSKYLPVEKQQAILKTFAKFQQKVLWKYEDESLPNKPDNMKISKWFPQTDILAHPNVKLFITHGGLLSSTEAVFRGVPIIGIPVYGDQFANIAKFVSSGFGQSILLEDLTEEAFTRVIKEVLDNPSYDENIKKTSAILRDQPDRPVDRAVFWVEHVIRHNGARHLRSSSVDLPLYQYLLLDILGAFAAISTIFVTLIYVVARKLCCCSKKAKKEEKESAKAKKVKPKRE